MKLLFDENLSESLCSLVADIYPEGQHVRLVGLQGAADSEIWQYASEQGYTLVSKDSDFVDRAIISDLPTKVIWIRLGNCSTANVHLLLRNRREQIEGFIGSEDFILELP